MYSVRNWRSGLLAMLLAAAGADPAWAQVKIDFNMSGRTDDEVLETGWTGWIPAAATSESRTVSGTTFKLAVSGTATKFANTWYKAGIQNPNYARLVCDGVTTDGTSGGAIQLTISGLADGAHSLLVYHNAVDGNAWAPVDVSVNGTKKTTVQPTNRALSTDASAFSFVSFQGTGATILFAPGTGTGTRNVVLNGLALDVPDPAKQAKEASPEDRDLHADADAGSIVLKWTAPTGAASHELYVGNDSATVANAASSSGAYVGKFAQASYTLNGINKQKYYWWRVDETDGAGVVTRGAVWSFAPRRLAFPSAEGYGRYARGGRGGRVVHVTSLADDGSKGTLRWAVTDSTLGPRTIVFDVGGYIKLGGRLTLSDPFVTVAGQTAPAPGICIRSAPFGLSGAKDVIMRFMKVRLGYGITFDGMGMQGSDHSILDHNTINWTIDEAFSSRDAKNITLQRTLIAEALNDADHSNYPSGTQHGYAGTISGKTGSFHHLLLAHNHGRNFSMGSAIDGNNTYVSRLDLFNNVVYNFGTRANDGQCHWVNFVNNYYKKGAGTTIDFTFKMDYENYGNGTLQSYYAGNILQNTDGSFQCDGTSSSCGRKYTLNNDDPGPVGYDLWVSSPLFPSYAKIQTAKEAFKDVLSDVGQTQPVLDTHDIRNINEALNGTVWGKGSKTGIAGHPDRESDVGGFMPMASTSRAAGFDTDADGLPDWYETMIGTNPKSAVGDFAEANADPVGDGWTNLERYLEYMATPHAETKVGTATTFDLAALFRGYQKTTPTYSIGTNSCLTATLSGSKLDVTPKTTCGIAVLPVAVVDKDKATKTRDVAVYVTGSTPVSASWGTRAPDVLWLVDPTGVAVETSGEGGLVLRDLSGRVLRSASGAGRVHVSTTGMNGGLVVASWAGAGRREDRVIQIVR